MNIIPVILAGGIGGRLWPLSREAYPKHLLSFLGDHSLLQDALLRVQAIPDGLAPIIVTHVDYAEMIERQLQQLSINETTLLFEPVRRNTAPAIAAAASVIIQQFEDALMLVLPADLIIKDVQGFVESVLRAKTFAEQGQVVTFGIKPDYPETGYGYIHCGGRLAESCFGVQQFVEKPDEVTAETYVNSGEYYWNGGMYLLGAQQYLDELQQLTPGIVDPCRQAVNDAQVNDHQFHLVTEHFSQALDISIDKALAEKTQNIVMAELTCDWRDAGSWKSLYDNSQWDDNNNAILGDVLSQESRGCYIRAENTTLAVLGVEDLVIVEADGVVLVAHKDKVQSVKSLAKQFQEKVGCHESQ